MVENKNDSIICGSIKWPLLTSNDSASFINDVLLCVINAPFCIFAFLANLTVIIAVIKTPSLQRPSNILLCGLAITDCLTGLVAQPLFVAWNLMVRHIHESCHRQTALFQAFNISRTGLVGWSLANITVISFDRHYAISKPLQYRVRVRKKDAGLAAFVSGIAWILVTLAILVLPEAPGLIPIVVGVILISLTVINHVGTFVAIRRHNNQMIDVISGMNTSVILRREKKAFFDMLIVIAVLLICLVPSLVYSIYSGLFPEDLQTLPTWSINLIYINSCLNPIIYLVRNSEIRNAVKSMIC